MTRNDVRKVGLTGKATRPDGKMTVSQMVIETLGLTLVRNDVAEK